MEALASDAAAGQFAPIAQIAEAHYGHQFDTNELGPVLVRREAPKLFPAECGSVVNVCCIASDKGLSGVGRLALADG